MTDKADDAPLPSRVEAAKDKIQPRLMERMDFSAASTLKRGELAQQLGALVAEMIQEEKIQLNALEQRDLVTSLLNDMLGFRSN